MNENRYTDLIAGGHTKSPLYREWVYTLTEPFNTLRERLAKMQDDFALDFAVGDQLDAIGDRVGVSRNLPATLSDVYFALDDDGGVGLDLGVWKGPYDPTDGLISLGDETYRAVIKSKILMNHWDGQNGTLPDFITGVLNNFGVTGKVMDLQDFQTMRVAINLTKTTTPPIVWEIISRRIIDIVAAGVELQLTNNDPWFALDYETASVKGFDQGHWFPFEGKTAN